AIQGRFGNMPCAGRAERQTWPLDRDIVTAYKRTRLMSGRYAFTVLLQSIAGLKTGGFTGVTAGFFSLQAEYR
ncbi:MAG: hypothetical protein ACRD5Z_20860, partial [Bryobacteraceae bacterium]